MVHTKITAINKYRAIPILSNTSYFSPKYLLITVCADSCSEIFITEKLFIQSLVTEGIEGGFGYGYLNSKEKEMNSDKPYHRRLLDQTHTLQIFLQDRFRKHPNWQSHLRILFGSGFLYNYRSVVKNPNTGINELVINLDNPQEYFIYLRVDMGLSASFEISNTSKMTLSVEVLNVFNHYNIAGYEWVRIFDDANGIVKIPKILSKRFFNLKVELTF